jgi:heat shock protein HslJ
MACAPAVMAQEDKFLKALSASKRYEISPQGLMRFFDQAGAVTVRFSRIN